MIYPENIMICIAVPLLITAVFSEGRARHFAYSFVAGMVICLLSAYIGGFLQYRAEMSPEDTSIFISPILEEIMKMLPVFLYLIIFAPSDKELLVISLGTGAGFATFENICHILAYGAESISYVMIRGFAAGIMHIISVYALALAMIRLKRYNISYVYVIAGGLGLSMSFHALYNLLVSEAGITSYIGYALPVSAAAVLVLIVKRDRSYKGATE